MLLIQNLFSWAQGEEWVGQKQGVLLFTPTRKGGIEAANDRPVERAKESRGLSPCFEDPLRESLEFWLVQKGSFKASSRRINDETSVHRIQFTSRG